MNVEHSLCGKRWEGSEYDERAAASIAQLLDVPPLIAQMLANRGLTAETAGSFLVPRLKEQMPDPSSLLDMDKAVSRFIDAIENSQKITVFGDYDVDGATSTALLLRFGRALGHEMHYYIPDRMTEGYGPNVTAMQKLKDGGTELLITVDCGVTAHEPLRTAAKLGMDVIVLDHHAAEPALPPAVAVVNPNRLDENNNIGACAACGVTFLFIVAVNRALRERGFYTNKPEPDLLNWLDIVALGTVADVVPLTGLNRAFVAQGLKVMAQRQNAGIAALCDIGRVTNTPDAFTCGFILGPRVNAGGRVRRSDLGARILSTEDDIEARELAAELDSYNSTRKEIESQVLEEAIAHVEGHNGNMIMAVGKGWHPGVIGIVAARLKERYYRPTYVIAVDEKGIGKGSGRSIRGVDLGALTISARQSGLLANGGGHAMAAGLTVQEENILRLGEFFEERLAATFTPEIAQPRMVVDGVISLAALNEEFYMELQKMAPFGTANFEPRFVVPNCKIVNVKRMGKDQSHIHAILSNDAGQRVRAVAFNCASNALGEALLAQKQLHVCGKACLNEWNGRRSVEFVIEDAAIAV